MFRGCKTIYIFVFGFLFLGWLEAVPRIDTIEPIYLQAGKKTKVKIKGNEFKLLKWPTRIWTNHPSKWTLLEDEDNTNNQHFFEVEIARDVPAGPLAIRAWNLNGVSKPSFAFVDIHEASSFRTKNSEAYEHRFDAKKGERLVCQVWSNRLNKDSDLQMTIFDPEDRLIEMIDDSEVHGSDPYVVFDPPADGEYSIKINDILWQDNIQACVQVSPFVEMQPNGNEIGKTPASISLELKKGQYLTVMPKSLELGSPAQLLMDLHEPKGGRIARFGNGDSLLQPLRKRIPKDGDYHLRVSDLLNREGLPYQVDISTEVAPFELATTFHQDFYITEPGKEVKIRFRVIRHQYDGPITIRCPVFKMEKAVIAEKRGDVEAVVKIPRESESLVVTSFYGEAVIDGQTYRTTVGTKEPLKKTPLNMIQWPEGVSGKVYFLIKSKGGMES
tara:strand:+ start:2150 stop:3478 length:1329 start_codon:yes stop_codon:yes gene_type:complete